MGNNPSHARDIEALRHIGFTYQTIAEHLNCGFRDIILRSKLDGRLKKMGRARKITPEISTAACALSALQIGRGRRFVQSADWLRPGPRPLFLSFVSLTAAASAVVSFIRQLTRGRGPCSFHSSA
jgi:hypothetical protein